MPTNGYVVGEVYYLFGIGWLEEQSKSYAVVGAWRYDGIVRRAHTSSACDVPYCFLCFTRLPIDDGYRPQRDPLKVYVPSEKQAQYSYLDWLEFRATIMDWDNNDELPAGDNERANGEEDLHS